MSDSIDVVALRFVSAGGEAVMSDAQRVRANVEESLNRSVAAGEQFLATINGKAATAIQSSLQLAEAVKLVDVQNRASVAGWIKTRDAALDYAASCGVLAETELHLGAATQQLILDQQEYAGFLKASAAATRELNASQLASAESSGLHGLQLGRVNQELGTFIGRVTGGNTAMTRLAAQIGGAAAGYGPMIAGLVGLGAVLWVWEKFVGDSKEAQKALEEFQKTSEAMSATNAAIGSLKQGASAAGFDAHLGDIPALSEDAKKAADVVDDLQKKLSGLLSGSLNGNAVLAPLRDIANSASQGHLTLDQLDASLGAIPEIARYFPTIAKDVGDFSAQLIVAIGAQDRVRDSLLQAAAVHRYYTDELKAATVGEGQLLEKIAQAQTILAAFQGGGIVAGKRAEDDAKAYDAAQKVYEDYAKSAKGASVATIAFGDAYKNTLSSGHEIAVSFFNEQKQLFEINAKIADAQKQAATGMSDDGRITSLTDQIARLAQEADAFGKDGSIQNRIQGLDDQLDQFLGTLQQQVALGKLSSASFEAQAATVEDLRQKLYSAGDALRQVADAQITKQIHEEYLAQKELFDGVTAGVGGVRELTAAKAAELEIAQRRVQLGHDLSQDLQDEILRTKQLAVATSEAATTQGMQQKLDAILQENEAMRAGESTREAYAINQRADLEVTKALTLSTVDLAAARILVVNATRDAELAHLGLVDAEKESQKSAAEAAKAQQSYARSIERDVLSAVTNLTSHGLPSFSSFFSEIDRMSLRMVEQLSQNLQKLNSVLEDALYKGSQAAVDAAQKAVDHMASLANVAGKIGAAISGGLAGFGVGSQVGQAAGGVGFGSVAAGAGAGAGTGALAGAAIGTAVFPGLGTAAGAAIGAIAGSLAGLTGALLGGSKAAQERKAAEEALRNSLTDSLTAIHLQLGDISQTAADIYDVHKQFNTLRDQTDAAYAGTKNEAERNQKLGELNDLEARRVAQLTAEAAAVNDANNARIAQMVADSNAANAAAAYQEWLAKFQAFSDRNQADVQSRLAADAQAEQDRQAAMQIAQDAVTLAQQQLDTSKGIYDKLSEFSQSLLLDTSRTILSPAQQLEEARKQFQAQTALALQGNSDAASSLPQFAQTFLDASRAYNASGAQYVADFQLVQSSISAVTDQFGAMMTVDQMMLDVQKRQLALLDEIAHPFIRGTSSDPNFYNENARDDYGRAPLDPLFQAPYANPIGGGPTPSGGTGGSTLSTSRTSSTNDVTSMLGALVSGGRVSTNALADRLDAVVDRLDILTAKVGQQNDAAIQRARRG